MKNNEIWVVYDNTRAFEENYMGGILAKASSLAKEKGVALALICIGLFQEVDLESFFYYGTDKIILYKETGNLSEHYFTCILEEMIIEKQPQLVMFPASDFGKACAAYISVRFESGLTADCIDIHIDNQNQFVYSRAAINSSTIAKIKCKNSKFEMCTVKKNVFAQSQSSSRKSVNIKSYLRNTILADDMQNFNVLSRVQREVKKNIDLSSAKVVFGMGRGMKDSKARILLYSLAEKLGATVVGTRAAVEENLIEKYRQVGQSGVSISPDIYVAFGISGASQHMVGVKNSKIILAVNIDKNAPIFRYADYVIVDDLFSVLENMDIICQKEEQKIVNKNKFELVKTR